MAFASTSQTSVAYVAETTIGTTPATPAFKKIRRTGGNLNTRKGLVVSDEIQADRNIRDELQISQEVSGSYDFEFSYGSFDDLIEAALCGTWATNALINSTSIKTFTFEERAVIGASSEYNRFVGCYVESMSLNIQSAGVIKGSFDIVGQSEATAQAAITGSTYTEPNTNVIETGVSVGTLSMTGVSSTPKIRNLSVNVKNNLRQRMQLGSLYSAERGLGVFDVEGSFEAYFENNDIYQAVIDHGSLAIFCKFGSVANQRYTLTIPTARLLGGTRRIGGKNDDIIASVPFRGVYQTATAASIKINRAVA